MNPGLSIPMEYKPGIPIGHLIAQECSAPATQSALSAFHNVGSSATSEVQVSKIYSSYLCFKTKSSENYTYVYPKDPSRIKDLLMMIEEVYLKDLIVSCDVQPSEYQDLYLRYYHDINVESVQIQECISFKLDKAKLYNHRISLFYIKHVLESTIMDIVVIPSPTKDGIVEVAHKDQKKSIELLFHGLLGEVFVSKNSTSIHNIQVKGVKNIRPQYIDEKHGRIVCKGNNIHGLKYVGLVDMTRTYTSDIKATYRNYGIIATAEVIKLHLNTIFTSKINNEALDLLIRNMIYKGYPMPVSQQGTTQQGRSIMFRLCYEQLMYHLQTIPVGNEFPIKDCFDCLAVGKTIPIGDNAKSNQNFG